MKQLSGKALLERAKKLGIDTRGDPRPASSASMATGPSQAPDYELQRRVQQAEASIRGGRLWILAIISAAASVLSAVAAIIAVSR